MEIPLTTGVLKSQHAQDAEYDDLIADSLLRSESVVIEAECGLPLVATIFLCWGIMSAVPRGGTKPPTKKSVAYRKTHPSLLRAPIQAGVGRNLEEQIHLGDGDIYGDRRAGSYVDDPYHRIHKQGHAPS
ncbi:hypothetical protein Tco_1490571 [Tanacetum coccineum]